MVEFKKLWRSLKGESKAEVRDRHRLLVLRLDRANERGENLDRLRGCSEEHPCRLEACPVCLRWFRRALLRAFREANLHKEGWTRVSVILGGQAVRPGGFQPGWLTRAVGSVRKQIERGELSDCIIIGGIDLSLNTLENGDHWWVPHAYLLLNEDWSRDLEGKVRRSFRLCPDARRPVGLAPIAADDLLRCVTYSYKNGFYRRSSYLEPDRRKANGEPRRNTRSQSLSPASEVELARALAPFSVGSRLIMRNMRRTTAPTSDRVDLTLLRPIVRA